MDIELKKNEHQMKQLLFHLQKKTETVKLGGGKSRIAKEHEKGKLTARERIDYLIDKESGFLEIGVFAADGMYVEGGACSSVGVVTGIR